MPSATLAAKLPVGDEEALRDVPDAVLPCPAVGRRKRRAVDDDFTPGRLVQSQQQVEERRFPGARGSADTDALALADRQRKAVEKLAPAVREAEPKVAHGDLAAEGQFFGGADTIGGGVPGIAGSAGIAGGNGCGGCAVRAGSGGWGGRLPALCGIAPSGESVLFRGAVLFRGVAPSGDIMSFRGVVLSRGICRGAGNWACLRGFPAGRGGVREVPGCSVRPLSPDSG